MLRVRSTVLFIAALAFVAAPMTGCSDDDTENKGNDSTAPMEDGGGDDQGSSNTDGGVETDGGQPSPMVSWTAEETSLTEAEALAEIKILTAAISDTVTDEGFDSIMDFGSPITSFLGAMKSLRDVCKPDRSLDLPNKRLILRFNCQDTGTVGDIIISRGPATSEASGYIQFTEDYNLRHLDITGSLVLKRKAKDTYDVFPGPRNEAGINSHNGKRNKDDRLSLRRFRDKKHRLIKLAFLGALVINRSKNQVELTFDKAADAGNKVGLYASDKGENETLKDADFQKLHPEDFIVQTPKALTFGYPVSCVCPGAGEMSFEGKYKAKINVGLALKNKFALVRYAGSEEGYDKGVVFMQQMDNVLQLLDLTQGKVQEFKLDLKNMNASIASIQAAAKTLDATLDGKISDIITQVMGLYNQCDKKTITDLKIGGLDMSLVCLDFSAKEASFPMGVDHESLPGLLKLAAGDKEACADRAPVASGFTFGDAYKIMDSPPQPIPALIAKLPTDVKGSLLQGESTLLWPSGVFKVWGNAYFNANAEAFKTKAAESIAKNFNDKILAAKLCVE